MFPNRYSIRAVIFDCDGTLVDSEYGHYSAWRYALQNQGGDLSEEEYYFFVGKPLDLNAKLFAEKIGGGCVEQIIADKRRRYSELQREGLPPIQPTIDFVHRLAEGKERLGLKLIVASAATKEETAINLEQLDIAHLFDMVLSGHQDLVGYSDPEGVCSSSINST